MSWFSRLKQGLKRSSNKITEGISSVIQKKKLDENTLEQLEEVLISADLGIETSSYLINALSKERFNKEVTDKEIREILSSKIKEILEPVEQPLLINDSNKPHVIIFVGVNGSGKTTTIGKLAKKWKDESKSVRLVAGDTFRAAASEQLKIWGNNIEVPVSVEQQGSDPASLSFKALTLSKQNKEDLLLIDTAGRLHNKINLMQELEKVYRVIKKVDNKAPHSSLLVLDATVGQNAFSQVEMFKKMVNISGILMTKLDGTAKGGVLIGLSRKFKLPIHFIGIGEKVDDLRPFNARNFADCIMGL